ncbi:MAG: CotH kinase family protein [Bacteroidales bacterium]|nr:CotH kinase family protein [Bacteroidales bacterium]
MKIRVFLTIHLFLFVSVVFAVDYPYNPQQRIEFTSSDLPIVIIELNEPMKSKDEDQRVDATMTIVDRKDGLRNKIEDFENAPDFENKDIFDYHGKIGIKYRGNSSFTNSDKKPFSVRTQNEKGKKKEVSILGMGADSDWALLAPFSDKSMIRDVLTFDLARDYFDYTPTGKYCELVLEGVYQGIYIVAARVRRGTSRLNLPEPGESGDALTGGYHLEIDRSWDDPGFFSKYKPRDAYGKEKGNNIYFQYKYPEKEDYDNGMQKQEQYIQDFINRFEDALNGDDFKDSVDGYRAFLDVTSTIDFIFTQEITRNVDGYRLSTPIYKYNNAKDSLLKFSIWDFNISLGNANYMDGQYTTGWVYDNNRFDDANLVPFWFKRLMEDESFYHEMKERWSLYRSTNYSEENVHHKIDSLTNLLGEASVRNFEAWPILGKWVWPNAYVGNTWEGEINYLKGYITDRIHWIDEQLELYKVDIDNGTATPFSVCKGVEVCLTAAPAPEGMIFDRWEGDDLISFADPYSESTTFIMPGEDVYVTALYKSSNVNINQAEAEQQTVYPNPADDFIMITGIENGACYSIINYWGQTVQYAVYDGSLVDVSALFPGVYILKTGEKRVLFFKR